MVYIDTSALLKLLWVEPESGAVRTYVSTESVVVVSDLTELEADVQLKSAWLAGKYRAGAWNRLRVKLREFRDTDPFSFQELSGTLLATALRQHRAAGRTHCRTLDRLHLAAMEELQVRRLLTEDEDQATAARALGFDVVTV